MWIIFLVAVVFTIENKFFMALSMIEIGKPADTFYPNILSAIIIYTASSRTKRVIVGDIKLSVPAMYAYP